MLTAILREPIQRFLRNVGQRWCIQISKAKQCNLERHRMVLRRSILVDVTARRQRLEQAMRRTLGPVEPLGERSRRHTFRRSGEHFDEAQAAVDVGDLHGDPVRLSSNGLGGVICHEL